MINSKLSIYCHSIAPSIDGVCRRFTGILNQLVLSGHDILLFTLEEDPKEIPSKVKFVTLNHMFMPTYPGKKVGQPSILSSLRILNALNKFKPDIMHITGDAFSQSFSFICNLLGIPIIGSFHTDLIDLLKTHDAYNFQKWLVLLMEYVDNFILDSCATTSASFSQKLANQGLNCQHIIRTAVDIETFNKNKRNRLIREKLMFGDINGFLCVYVGRISREKRLDIIIDAIREIDCVYLAIIGDGPSANIYAKLHGKQNRVFCVPKFFSHDELAEIYASSDLHVSASEFETLGNTVLEAFACSIPVVVPRTQGFCDTVTENVNGFFFEPGNSRHAKELIERFVNDKSLCTEFGNVARKSVENRALKFVVDDLIEWYRKGIENRKKISTLTICKRQIIMCILIPFTIIAMNAYNILVAVLKVAFVFENTNNKHKYN